MRRIDWIVALASVAVTLLFYPRTFLLAEKAAEDSCTYIALDGFSGEARPSEAPDAGRTPVVFMFDDGWACAYTVAYPLLGAYGFRGSVAAIPSFAGDKEYLSYPQLGRLYMRGWDVLNHTYAHMESRYEDCQAQFSDFQRAGDWMVDHRMPKGALTAVCPYGEANPYLIRLLMKNGYESVRTSDNIMLLNRRAAEYLPVNVLAPSQSDSLSGLESVLLESAGTRKPILLIFHKLGDTPDGTGMTFSPGMLEDLLRFLQKHADTFQVVPYSSLIFECVAH